MMFQGQGDFYCMNGCFSYPMKISTIKSFFGQLTGINNIDQIICYDIHPNEFSYQNAMDAKYRVKKTGLSILDTTTLLSLDFFYYDLSCQLQANFFDDGYYCLSLVHNAEEGISEEKYLKLKKCFYSSLKPIYGNDGYEKWLVSLNDIQKDDYSIFDNNFYISRELCERMNNGSLNVRSDTITVLENGIYYTKQSKVKQKALFGSFYDAVQGETR